MNRRITFDMINGSVDERMFRRTDVTDDKIIQSMVGSFAEIDALDDDGLIQNENAISDYWIGDTRLYQTFFRENKANPYEYAGLCMLGKHHNMHPRTAIGIILHTLWQSEEIKKDSNRCPV